MEIKKIEKHIADYPNTNEVSREEIKKKVPKNFLKFSVALALMQSFHSNINASVVNAQLAGDISYIEPVIAGGLSYIHPIYTISTNVEVVSLSIFVLSMISIGVTKILHKIKKIDKPVPKIFKILAIFSGVLSLAAAIGIYVFG